MKDIFYILGIILLFLFCKKKTGTSTLDLDLDDFKHPVDPVDDSFLDKIPFGDPIKPPPFNGNGVSRLDPNKDVRLGLGLPPSGIFVSEVSEFEQRRTDTGLHSLSAFQSSPNPSFNIF